MRIATIDEARLAIAAGADAIGFNGARPPGPRTIPDSAIADIAAAVPAGVSTCLLTTEQSADAITAQVLRTRATAVQILHPLSPVESERLAAALPHIHRVQVVHVEGPDAIALIPIYAAHVNGFLLDSGRPGAATPELGGTGRIHDWGISAAFVRLSPKPAFLAGRQRCGGDPQGPTGRPRSMLGHPNRRPSGCAEADGVHDRRETGG